MAEPLTRSRTNRVIGGVAAGMGRSLGIDPTWVRVGWVFLAFATQGFAVILYVALLFVIPEGDASNAGEATDHRDADPAPATRRDDAADARTGPGSAALVAGLVLIAAGVWLLLRPLLPPIDLALAWPLIAIVAGIVLVVVAMRSGRSG